MALDEGGGTVKVQRSNVHRCDSGASPVCTVPARETSWTVPVGELQAWLQQYEQDNQVDLVLKSVNGSRSRKLFDQLVAELATAAGTQAADNERAAAAALTLCQQQQQQP